MDSLSTLKNAALRAQRAVSETVESGANLVVDSANEVRKSATEAIDELGHAASTAHKAASSSVVQGTGRLIDGVMDATDSASKGLSSAANRAQLAVALTVESGARRVIDGALDVKDVALGGVAKTVGGTWDAAAGVLKYPLLGELIGLGVGIGLIAAPVPVAIGIGILMLVDTHVKDQQEKIQGRVDEAIQRRTKDRVAAMLKKYGEIPETAIIETAMVKVHLNSRKGTITGVVKTGNYQGIQIEDLDHYGFFRLIESCGADHESRQILESLERIRLKSIQGAISQ